MSRAFCSAGAVVTGVCDLEYSTLSGHCTLEPVHTVRQLAPCLWCAIVHRKRSGVERSSSGLWRCRRSREGETRRVRVPSCTAVAQACTLCTRTLVDRSDRGAAALSSLDPQIYAQVALHVRSLRKASPSLLGTAGEAGRCGALARRQPKDRKRALQGYTASRAGLGH